MKFQNFGGSSVFETIYQNNILEMEEYRDLSARIELLSGVRLHDRESMDIYWNLAIVTIYPTIIADINNIVRLNRSTEAGMQRDEVFSKVLIELIKSITDPGGTAWRLFESCEDIVDFQKFIRRCSINIMKKQANFFHRQYKKAIKNVNFEDCEEQGSENSENPKGLDRFKTYQPDYFGEIYQKTLLQAIHEIVEAMNNPVRREIIRATLNNRKPGEISKMLKINPNTVSSHLNRGKKEIYNKLKKQSLI